MLSMLIWKWDCPSVGCAVELQQCGTFTGSAPSWDPLGPMGTLGLNYFSLSHLLPLSTLMLIPLKLPAKHSYIFPRKYVSYVWYHCPSLNNWTSVCYLGASLVREHLHSSLYQCNGRRSPSSFSTFIYRAFLTVPSDFQYQNEKRVVAL